MRLSGLAIQDLPQSLGLVKLEWRVGGFPATIEFEGTEKRRNFRHEITDKSDS